MVDPVRHTPPPEPEPVPPPEPLPPANLPPASPGAVRQQDLRNEQAAPAVGPAATQSTTTPEPAPPDASAVSPGELRQIDNAAAAEHEQLQLEMQRPAVDRAVGLVQQEQALGPFEDRPAQVDLNEAVAGELAIQTNAELRVRQVPPGQLQAETDRMIRSYGDALLARYGSDPALAAPIRDAIDRYRAERWVQDATTVANAAPTPEASATGLVESLQALPPELQHRLPTHVLDTAQTTRLLTDAAKWATEPAAGAETAERLGGLLSQPMPDIVRDELVRTGTDNIVASYANNPDPLVTLGNAQQLIGGLRANPNTRAIADDVATALASNLRDGRPLAEPGMPSRETEFQFAIGDAIAQGGDPAFALELARQYAEAGDTYGAQAIFSAAAQGYERLRNSPPEDAMGRHGRTMDFLSQIVQGAATPEAAQAAIDAFYAGDPEAAAARDAVARYGAQLISASAQFGTLSPELQAALDVGGLVAPDGTVMPLDGAPDPSSALREGFMEAFEDPGVRMAVDVALEQNPELLDGQLGENFISSLGVVHASKLGDQVREFVTRLSGNFVDRVINSEIAALRAGIDPTDRTGPGQLKQRLQARLATMPDEVYNGLGVSRSSFERALGIIDGNLPTPADSVAVTVAKLQRIDEQLRGITGLPGDLLQDDSAGMRALRSLGAAAGAVALGDALREAIANPDAQAYVSLMSEVANMSKSSAETLVALNRANPAGIFGFLAGQSETHAVASRAANRVLGIVGAAGDAANIIESLTAKGGPDYAKAGLYSLGLAGTGLMAVSSTALAAGVGAPLVIASVLGVAQYEHVQQSNEFDHAGTRQALEAMRFDKDAADSLADQSGEGYSAVAPLFAYGEARGLTPEQTRNWINGIATRVNGAPSKLDLLRDNLHHTLDEINGDLSQLPATDPEADAQFLAMAQARGRGGTVTSEDLILDGNRAPMSMRQIDDVLQVLGIAPPQPS